ncbi:toll/interleukin-1 receptor domain-containing protein [Micromonospora sp. WMMD1076]|uniref:toll/interleukin-1 receptor domain-containing protein n=1 Tax=Micromonospora sp. WMMD1076 TaxID=3016103 RepID=UPI00249C7F9F|nr:toll/interleukin-1 receptor domain-containing protein [Micromonospora sp. WMMD1076]WFF08056.1 toll/interleukin-1 receptor domain-containing protein [Micromonospora sp. WMMD1076]
MSGRGRASGLRCSRRPTRCSRTGAGHKALLGGHFRTSLTSALGQYGGSDRATYTRGSGPAKSGQAHQASDRKLARNDVRRNQSNGQLVEPGAGSREPGAGSREPGAGSREPGAGSREPGAGSREPGAGSREPIWDVFVSYARCDHSLAAPIVAALWRQGLRVFVDEAVVDDFASISRTINRELAASLVLLAFYSEHYPRRRACQWELTAAYLAGQREGDVYRRVLVVNPAVGGEHIHPVELRDSRHGLVGSASDSPAALAAKVAEHVRRLDTPIGRVEMLTPALWLPAPPRRGTPDFVGRIPHLWRLHSALHPHVAPLLTGRSVPATVILRGGPGTGKTTLIEEYAIRFAAAFPGGVFWMDLDGCVNPIEAYTAQLRSVCAALGVADASSLEGCLNGLAILLGRRGLACLWVVDGVPAELPDQVMRRMFAPTALAATVLTTRGSYDGLAAVMDLDEPQVRRLPATNAGLTAERAAAFDLQIELTTRIGVQLLGEHEGLLREALNSLHQLFDTTRATLRRHGPDAAAVHTIAAELLNDVLRPFLVRWHTELSAYEEQRAASVGVWQHERQWPMAAQLRTELSALREPLTMVAQRLAGLSGVAIPQR